MRRELIVRGRVSDFYPVGVDGQLVYLNSDAFISALVSNQDRYGDIWKYFAVAKLSSDGNYIDWFTPKDQSRNSEGTVIVPWHEASDEIRGKAVLILEDLEESLSLLGIEAGRGVSASRNIFLSSCLSSEKSYYLPVFHFPGAQCIFFVNGDPVITFWGFCNNPGEMSSPPLKCLDVPVDDDLKKKYEKLMGLSALDHDSSIERDEGNSSSAQNQPLPAESVDSIHSEHVEVSPDNGVKYERAGTASTNSTANQCSEVKQGDGSCQRDSEDNFSSYADKSFESSGRQSKRHGLVSNSTALLILAFAVFLLTSVLLLKFVGVFDSEDVSQTHLYQEDAVHSQADSSSVSEQKNDAESVQNQVLSGKDAAQIDYDSSSGMSGSSNSEQSVNSEPVDFAYDESERSDSSSNTAEEPGGNNGDASSESMKRDISVDAVKLDERQDA